MNVLILLVIAIVIVYFIVLVNKRDTFRFGGGYGYGSHFRGSHPRQTLNYWRTRYPSYIHPMMTRWPSYQQPLYDYILYNYPSYSIDDLNLESCLKLQKEICNEKPDSKACLDKSACYNFF